MLPVFPAHLHRIFQTVPYEFIDSVQSTFYYLKEPKPGEPLEYWGSGQEVGDDWVQDVPFYEGITLFMNRPFREVAGLEIIEVIHHYQ